MSTLTERIDGRPTFERLFRADPPAAVMKPGLPDRFGPKGAPVRQRAELSPFAEGVSAAWPALLCERAARGAA
ncbi:MAG TPA: hypothetical protein VFG53_14845 [Anaeromyxobacter sp.]|nr:hypothetical protein [Anaeromyxobacter sp.]